MFNSFTQRAAAATFATAILVVVTLLPPPITELDAPLLHAVHYFIWSAALLGSALIMAAYDDPLIDSDPRERLSPMLYRLLMVCLGISQWSLGAREILNHFRMDGWEYWAIFVLASIAIFMAAKEQKIQRAARNKGAAKAERSTMPKGEQIVSALRDIPRARRSAARSVCGFQRHRRRL